MLLSGGGHGWGADLAAARGAMCMEENAVWVLLPLGLDRLIT